MDQFFSVLRAGTAPRSSPTERQAAAAVCRLLLSALETPLGQPLAFPGAPSTSEAPVPFSEDSPSEAEPTQDAAPAQIAPDASIKAVSSAMAPDLAEADRPAALAPANSAAEESRVAPGAAPSSPTAGAPKLPLDSEAVAALVRAARNVPTDQLLDLAIVRVQSLLKERGHAPSPPAPSPLGFPIVPLSASILGGKGGSYG